MKAESQEMIDEEDVRLTAYFLWQQEGRPDSDPQDFWDKALAIHRRAHGQVLEAGLAAQRGQDQKDV